MTGVRTCWRRITTPPTANAHSQRIATMTAAPAGAPILASGARVALLARVPAFGRLAPEVLAALSQALLEERAPAGSVVVREGDAADRVYLVAEGRAEVSTEGPQGAVALAVLDPGELFGEIGLLH